MYPIQPPALPVLPTTPQASVASMITPSDPAPGTLPSSTVAAPLRGQETHNEGRGNGAYVKVEAAAAATPEASPSAFAESATASAHLVATGDVQSFPALLLAQLLGQGADAEAQFLVASFEAAPPTGPARPGPHNKRLADTASGNPMEAFLKALRETS